MPLVRHRHPAPASPAPAHPTAAQTLKEEDDRMSPLESWDITPICRANRGVDGAWQEAVDQLRQVYDAQVTRFGPTATLTLSLSRSRANGVTQVVYNACLGVALRPGP